jgi:hypothetical protein
LDLLNPNLIQLLPHHSRRHRLLSPNLRSSRLLRRRPLVRSCRRACSAVAAAAGSAAASSATGSGEEGGMLKFNILKILIQHFQSISSTFSNYRFNIFKIMVQHFFPVKC